MPPMRRSMRRTARRTSRRTSRRMDRRQQAAAPPPQAAAPPPQQATQYVEAAPAAPEADVYEDLKKLGNLHAQGILTDEEFAAEKAKLLDS